MKLQTFLTLRQTFLPLALLAAGISACNKDDDKNNTPAPKGNAELIVGTWKQTAMTSDVDINGTKDIWSLWPACAKDGTETYASNGERTVDEGQSKCNPNASQSTVAPYALSGSALTVGGFVFTILQLDNTTLKYSYPSQNVNGSDTVKFTATLTFQRQ